MLSSRIYPILKVGNAKVGARRVAKKQGRWRSCKSLSLTILRSAKADSTPSFSNYPPEQRIILRHLSILRSPVPADILLLTVSQTKDMRALELLDMQKHFIVGNSLNHLKSALKLAVNLENFAMKVDGVVEQEGVLDDILQVS